MFLFVSLQGHWLPPLKWSEEKRGEDEISYSIFEKSRKEEKRGFFVCHSRFTGGESAFLPAGRRKKEKGNGSILLLRGGGRKREKGKNWKNAFSSFLALAQKKKGGRELTTTTYETGKKER